MTCRDYRAKSPKTSYGDLSRVFLFPFRLPEPGNMGQAILSVRDALPTVICGEETGETEYFFDSRVLASGVIPTTEVEARVEGYGSLAEAAVPKSGEADVRVCLTGPSDNVVSRDWVLVEESAKDHFRQLAGRRMAQSVITGGSILLGRRPGLEGNPTFFPAERAKAALTAACEGFPQGVRVMLCPMAVLCAEAAPYQLHKLVCNY